jgi:hypothetical protein
LKEEGREERRTKERRKEWRNEEKMIKGNLKRVGEEKMWSRETEG